MNPSIAKVLHRCARGEAAAFELYDWAIAQAGSRALAGRGHAVRIPENEREDVVLDVLIKLQVQASAILERTLDKNPARRVAGLDDAAVIFAEPPPAALAEYDASLVRYVRQMLGSRWLDVTRVQARAQRNLDAVVIAETARRDAEQRQRLDQAEGGSEAQHLLEQTLDALHAAVEFAAATRRSDPELLRASFAQLVALALGTQSMSELVAEVIEQDPALITTPADQTKARERIYRRHRLARSYMAEAIDGLQAAGTLSPEGADHARAALRGVLVRRCPIAARASVTPARNDDDHAL